MTLKVSTGLRNKMLDTSPLRTVLNLGFLKIYSGTPPASADDAIGGGNTLLCTISNASSGTGLTLETAAALGVLVKETTEVWSGNNANSGTATFYRHVAVGDTAVSSTTEARVQGSIGLAGEDMNLSSTALVAAAPQTIDYYAVALPSA